MRRRVGLKDDAEDEDGEAEETDASFASTLAIALAVAFPSLWFWP